MMFCQIVGWIAASELERDENPRVDSESALSSLQERMNVKGV